MAAADRSRKSAERLFGFGMCAYRVAADRTPRTVPTPAAAAAAKAAGYRLMATEPMPVATKPVSAAPSQRKYTSWFPIHALWTRAYMRV